MKPIELSAAPVTQLVMVSASHVSPADSVLLAHMSDDKSVWFTHAASDGGVIMRFSALGADFEEIEDSLKEYGFSSDFIAFIEMLFSNQFDAVHFDRDGDVIALQPWFTDEGQKVTPLADELPLLVDDYGNPCFEHDDELYSLNDFMRLDENGKLKGYGLHASMGESNTSALFIELADSESAVNLYRVVSEG